MQAIAGIFSASNMACMKLIKIETKNFFLSPGLQKAKNLFSILNIVLTVLC